ncbi:MAG: hypothetical protein WHV61_05580 [Burkholderiales bacterium]
MDNRFNGAPADIERLTPEESDLFTKSFLDRWNKILLREITRDNNGLEEDGFGIATLHRGHIRWNGRDYYAWAVSYLSAEQIARFVARRTNKNLPQAVPGGGICALYVFDRDLNRLAALRIDLPEADHHTWCNGIHGIGSAGGGIEGVLVSLSYYLTDKPPAKRVEDIGKGWRYMSVLIRFEERDGKLVLRQDDSCLGNPNRVSEIPVARKVLARCGAVPR